MRSPSRLTLAAVMIAAAAAAGTTPASAATLTAPSVDLANVVTVQADGAGVVITVDVRCDTGADYTYLSLNITQTVSGEIVNGQNSTEVRCTGALERMQLGVTSYVGEKGEGSIPFQPGTAFVTATIDQCAFECQSDETNRTLPLRERTVNRASYDDPSLTLDLPARGRVQAEGAGAVVIVQYTCAVGIQGSFYATLAQRSELGTVTAGSDGVNLTCSALNRRGVLAFHAGSSPWETGTAFFTLGGSACDSGFSCQFPQAFRTLRLSVRG